MFRFTWLFYLFTVLWCAAKTWKINLMVHYVLCLLRSEAEIKASPMRNDTKAVLSDRDSARAPFNPLNVLRKLSRLKMNASETEGMWVSSLRNNISKPFGIKWSCEPIKALGVYYSYNSKLLHERVVIGVQSGKCPFRSKPEFFSGHFSSSIMAAFASFITSRKNYIKGLNSVKKI